MIKHIILPVLAVLFISASALAEGPVTIKGTRISIEPPAGFITTDRFPGAMSEETGSSVMVTELPAPFATVIRGFDSKGFKTQGMTLLSEEPATFGELKGTLYSASQSANGIEFLKWLALFGDESSTFIVTGAFPKIHEDAVSASIKKAVLGARASGAPVDPMAAVTFRITPSGDIKLAKVISNMLLMSKDGVFPARGIDTPLYIAGASITKDFNVPDKKAFAEQRILKTNSLKNVVVKGTTPIEVDGLAGFETVADAADAESGVKASIYQAILFDADGYYLMQGITSEALSAANHPTFKEMTRSFKRIAKQ